MKLTFVFGISIQLCVLSAYCQGNFQNLNFEAANIPPGTLPDMVLPASEALPGWSVSEPTELTYDGVSTGGTGFSIIDSKAPFGLSPIAGSFSAVLFAGTEGGIPTISQTGLVPAGSKSILMDFAFPLGVFANAPTTVTMDGQQVAMVPLQTFPTYTVYGGDVSSYAGLTETLAITQTWNTPNPPVSPPSALELDNIQFSTSSIPEPGTWTLLLFGAGLFGVARRASFKFQI